MGAGAIIAFILFIFIAIFVPLVYTNTLCNNKLVGHGLCYDPKFCVGGFGKCDESIKPILPSECAPPPSAATPPPVSTYKPEPVMMVSEIEPYEKA